MTTPMKPNRPDLTDTVGDIKSRVRILEATPPTPPFTGIEAMDDHGDDYTDVESLKFVATGWAAMDVSQPRGVGTADVTTSVRAPATEFLTGAAYSAGYGGGLPFSHDFGSTLLTLTSPQVPEYPTDHDTLASLAVSVINSDALLTPGDIVGIQFSLYRSGPVFYADSGQLFVEVQAAGKLGAAWSSGDILLDFGPGPGGYVYIIQIQCDTLAHASHLAINRATFTAI